MSHTQIFDLSYTALCYLVIVNFLNFKIFQKTKRGMCSNIVTATELTHVKWINKYILFRPHISVEYNNISNAARILPRFGRKRIIENLDEYVLLSFFQVCRIHPLEHVRFPRTG